VVDYESGLERMTLLCEQLAKAAGLGRRWRVDHPQQIAGDQFSGCASLIIDR
jgi:hypothetical protein